MRRIPAALASVALVMLASRADAQIPTQPPEEPAPPALPPPVPPPVAPGPTLYAPPQYVPPPPPPVVTTRVVKQSYAWQTLLVDLPVAGVVVLGVVTDDVNLLIPGMLAAVFVPPVVHLFHGNGASAGKTILNRIGFPLLGAGVGVLVGEIIAPGEWRKDGARTREIGALAGVWTGYGTAILYDAVELAWEKKTVATTSKARPSQPSWTVAPLVDGARDRGGLVVQGRF